MSANTASGTGVANTGAVVPADTDEAAEAADRPTTNESATALVALVNASSPTPPPEPSAVIAGTLVSSLQMQPPPDEAPPDEAPLPPGPARLPVDQAAWAWIDHVEKGNAVPDGPTFVELMRALVNTRVRPPPPVTMASLASPLDVRLKLEDSGKKFPHMLDTQNGRLTEDDAVWTQCKTKMTHVRVRLVDSKGRPVKGTDVQEGGLALCLTLHKVVGNASEPLNDGSNPRATEGLFRGRASGHFEHTATVMESWHEFRFQVMLLSSDIAGARMFVKVAPKDPQLALNPNLAIQSHSFISRARMPDETYQNRQRQTAADATQLLDIAWTMAHRRAAAAAAAPADAEDDTESESRAASRAASPPPPPKRHCPSPVVEHQEA